MVESSRRNLPLFDASGVSFETGRNRYVNIDTDVYLRKVVSQDQGELLRLMRISMDIHRPWITPPTTPQMFRNYMERIRRSDHEGYAICRTTDECIVGVINLNHIVRGTFQNASLGYYVGKPYQGHGYMQQGLEQLLRLAFTTLGLHRLEANIQPGNKRSKKLVAACGFRFEGLSESFLFIDGQWRDHERWSACADRDTLRP